MPYADKQRQREYNANWWKNHPGAAVSGPLSRDVEAAVRRAGPIGPSAIVAEIGRSTPKAVSVALHRLRAYGRVKRIGYGKWVAE